MFSFIVVKKARRRRRGRTRTRRKEEEEKKRNKQTKKKKKRFARTDIVFTSVVSPRPAFAFGDIQREEDTVNPSATALSFGL